MRPPGRSPRAARGPVVLAVVATLLAGCRGEERVSEAADYVNEAYGFMLAYPATLTLIERAPGAAVLGRDGKAAFEPRVEIAVEGGDAESLEAFLHERALAACRRQAPDASVECSEVIRREPFTSLGGVEGERFHLRQISVRREGPTVEEERGPVYAFPLRAGPATARFVLLFIHPPFDGEAAQAEEELVHLLAATLRLTSAWVMR